MKYLKHGIIAGALAFATLNVASAAPILNIGPDSTLLGASGVNVGGKLYDVTFGDGTVDSRAITAFTRRLDALAASQALLDQVLLGNYDTMSLFTNGCTHKSWCYIDTPYFSYIDEFTYGYDVRRVEVAGVFNFTTTNFDPSSPYNDRTGEGAFDAGTDTRSRDDSTLARWSVSRTVAAVPEPETYALMFAGLGLLGFVAHRRKQKAAV